MNKEKKDNSTLSNVFKIKQLSDEEFKKLSSFIFESYGIKMPIEKKIMLQCRLQKRLRALNINSFKEYIDFVFSKEGREEVIHMIDVVSTNKTDFFREPEHFDFLKTIALPDIMQQHAITKIIKIWIAGCSSGEEVYTLGIIVSEFLENYPEYDFSILGTDISTQILRHATEAIYKEEKASVIPLPLKKKYLLRSIDRENPSVRIVPELRKENQLHAIEFYG